MKPALRTSTVSHRALLGSLLFLVACASGAKVVDKPDPPPNMPVTLPPEIRTLRPANHANGVPASTNVDAVFKEPMNPASINTGTFSLWTASGSEHVSGAVSYHAATKTATIDPDDDLPSGKKFKAFMDGFETAAGTDVDPFYWDFTIE